jgi:hypothetical protein
VRFEVLTVVKITMLFFWVVTLYGLVGIFLRVNMTSQPRTTTLSPYYRAANQTFNFVV